YPTLAETASFYNISYSEDNLHYSMGDSELVAKIFVKMLERAKSLKVKSSCPYCGFQLEKKPKKKTECPSCGNFIYVRTHPAIGLKILATKELASEIDAFWRG
ncbi:hypothetical protein KA005_38955, partial [bacterium]|nr:hypothetical protein [bacterium]